MTESSRKVAVENTSLPLSIFSPTSIETRCEKPLTSDTRFVRLWTNIERHSVIKGIRRIPDFGEVGANFSLKG